MLGVLWTQFHVEMWSPTLYGYVVGYVSVIGTAVFASCLIGEESTEDVCVSSRHTICQVLYVVFCALVL